MYISYIYLNIISLLQIYDLMSYFTSNILKKGETLLQTDLRLLPSGQSAVVVRNEPLGGDPVHG
jgi:hypothetical protein